MPDDRPPSHAAPTQRELARRAGVTQACVSMALRGSPRIPEATRERILALARSAGYLPDLALSALARRRWHERRAGIIAYLGSRGSGAEGERDRYLEAARARCLAQGLRLWYLPRRSGDDAEVQRALDRTRVAGVIVGQSTLLERPRALAWERLRAVHCGMIVPPDLGDVVCPDLPAAVPEAWRRLLALGHRRIAAVLSADPRAHSEQLLAGALLALERAVGDPSRLRVWIGPRRDAATAAAWIRSRRADAILGYDPEWRDQLRRSGIALPYAAMATIADRPDVAGMELPFAAVATASVELLADRLRDQPGPPPQRRMHLIRMPWREGPSLASG